MNDKMKEALNKAAEEIKAMSPEEFRAALENHQNGEWAQLLRPIFKEREMENFPRRNRIDKLTPQELSLREALEKVESMEADPLLTEVSTLILKAADKLADYVDKKLATNEHGRYMYWRTEGRNGATLLVKDDGCRVFALFEKIPSREEAGLPEQDGTKDWTLVFEYKHCDFPGLAGPIIEKLLSALEPAPISSIESRFLE